MTLISSMLDKNISIEWKDGSDWHWFKLVNWDNVDGEFWLLLDGRPSPDGDEYSRPSFWVRLKDISLIELGDIEPYWKRLVSDDDSI